MTLNYRYHSGASLEQVLGQLLEHKAGTIVKAGGTDVYLRIKQGTTAAEELIDLSDVKGLNYITFEAQAGLKIGAVTTVRAIEKSPELIRYYPALAEAASRVASVQIRNMGTIGGNLCQDNMCWYYNQSSLWKNTQATCFKAGGTNCHVMHEREGVCYATFRGDMAAVLIAMGAQVRVQSAVEERIMVLEALYSGDGKNPLTLKTGELVTEILVPPPGEISAACYLKLSHRKAVDYPLVGVAAYLELNSNGTVSKAKLAMTAVDMKPVVVEGVAELLLGRNLENLPLEEIAGLAHEQARPRKNVYHGAPKYRRQMAGVLSQRCLERIATSLKGKGA